MIAITRNKNILHAIDHLSIKSLPIFKINFMIFNKHMPESTQYKISRQYTRFLSKYLISPINPIRVSL